MYALEHVYAMKMGKFQHVAAVFEKNKTAAVKLSIRIHMFNQLVSLIVRICMKIRLLSIMHSPADNLPLKVHRTRQKLVNFFALF